MIYFMQSESGGPVKIGYSCDVERRRHEHESHYGRTMVVLCTMDGGKAKERAIHRKFKHLRLGRTEQFRPEPELLEFVRCPLHVSANGDVVEAIIPREYALAIRFTEQDKTEFEAIRTQFGLTSIAAAVRYAMHDLYLKIKKEEDSDYRV